MPSLYKAGESNSLYTKVDNCDWKAWSIITEILNLVAAKTDRNTAEIVEIESKALAVNMTNKESEFWEYLTIWRFILHCKMNGSLDSQKHTNHDKLHK